VALIEGDHEEELDALREPSQSSESASASERDQAIVGNVTQAGPRRCAGKDCKIAAYSQRYQQTPVTIYWRRGRAPIPFRRSRQTSFGSALL